jgi:purine nucleoside phosphorylase
MNPADLPALARAVGTSVQPEVPVAREVRDTVEPML